MDSSVEIQKAVRALASISPKADFSKNRADWDMGHYCMDYFAHHMPRENYFSPIWLIILLQRARLGKTTGALTLDDVYNAFEIFHEYQDVLDKALDDLREEAKTKEVTPELVNKYHSANCGEWAFLAQDWLLEQGVWAHQMHLSVMDENGTEIMIPHAVVLYANETNGKMTKEEMLQNINDPRVRIVDLWAQKCGQAADVLNDYCTFFVRNNPQNGLKTGELGAGVRLGVVEYLGLSVQNWLERTVIEQCHSEAEAEQFFCGFFGKSGGAFILGETKETGGKLTFVPYKTPQIYPNGFPKSRKIGSNNAPKKEIRQRANEPKTNA